MINPPRKTHAWRESSLYSERERAALAWTEAITLVAVSHAPDDIYATLRNRFSEEEVVKLTLAVGNINAWNRSGVGMRTVHPATEHLPAEAYDHSHAIRLTFRWAIVVAHTARKRGPARH